MPYVNVRVTPRITVAQKAEIIARITDCLVEVLGKKPEHTHVIIDEVEEQNWGYAGLLTSEYRKQAQQRQQQQ